MILAGLSCRDVRSDIVDRCVSAQQADGGFIGNTDTLWNAKLLSNYPEYHTNYLHAVQWLRDGNGVEPGWGRSKRDIHRIPVTGMVLYLLPELAQKATLEWLERTWLSERNSLTYKAAYTLLAFQKCGYKPRYMQELATDTADWLASQQQINGGFAPWRGHPVGENVYCTALAVLALTSLEDKSYYKNVKNAYNYLCYTQLRSGVWPYHEIEDGEHRHEHEDHGAAAGRRGRCFGQKEKHTGVTSKNKVIIL